MPQQCGSPLPAVPMSGDQALTCLSSAPGRSAWQGHIAMHPGVGVFRGQAGDNRPHHHWAHQLSLGVDGPVRLWVAGTIHEAAALFVRAGTAHQLLPGRVLSCYVDPTGAEARAILAELEEGAMVAPLPAAMTFALRDAFPEDIPLGAGLARWRTTLTGPVLPIATTDGALVTVLAALAECRADGREPDRAELARRVGLSESRFSHWFRERTGMPLRSYRKWLRLVQGMAQLQQGLSLTDAAHGAAFADQAHFTRSCVELFGVRPSDLVAALAAERRP